MAFPNQLQEDKDNESDHFLFHKPFCWKAVALMQHTGEYLRVLNKYLLKNIEVG